MLPIDGVLSGLAVDAIAAVGRQLAVQLAGSGSGRQSRAAAEVAKAFNTYSLVDLAIPDIPESVDKDKLITILRSNKTQALIQELFAVRLSDGAEEVAERINVQIAAACETECAQLLVGLINKQIDTVVVHVATVQPALLRQIRQEAFFTRINTTLEAIDRHLSAISQPYDHEAERQFWLRYRSHMADYHGKIEPPDFSQRRRVPIADLYVAPRILNITQPATTSRAEAFELFKPQMIDRTVLLGNPGGGKTTASNFLLYQNAIDHDRQVPFLVILREYAASNPPSWSVVEYIEDRMRVFYQCAPPEGAVNRLLLAGDALIVFDGLDELLDTSRRAEISSIIEQFCREYPLSQVLVTSRLVGYSEAKLDERQFLTVRIDGFDDEHVAEYVHKWFKQEPELPDAAAEKLAESFIRESSDITDLRSNPLMLALMCILYRGERSIPQSRSEVYEKCADLLFKKWDAHRQIQVELKARHLIEPALRYLAYWLLSRDDARAAVTRREIIAETATYFRSRGFDENNDPAEAAEEFVDFCRGRAWVFSEVGSTASGDELYTFTHRTFLEYFAAYYIASINERPEQLASTLAPRIAKGEWDMVGQLAVQIKDRNIERGAERIFVALLNERRRRAAKGRLNVLGFLARCLASVQPRPSIVGQLAEAILARSHREFGVRSPQGALAALISNSHDSPEPVAAAISVRAAEWLTSSSRSLHDAGLELACCLGECFPAARGTFWASFTSANVELYRDRILLSARHNDAMLWMAQKYDLLSFDEMLAVAEDPGRIFNVYWFRLFRFGMSPNTYFELTEALCGRASTDGLLSALGRYFLSKGEPPPFVQYGDSEALLSWVLRRDLARLIKTDHADGVFPRDVLPQEAYLALLVCIALTTEAAIEDIEEETEVNKREQQIRWNMMSVIFAPIPEFVPYVAARMRMPGADEPLPALPVDPSFSEYFAAWAMTRDMRFAGEIVPYIDNIDYVDIIEDIENKNIENIVDLGGSEAAEETT